MKPLDLMKSICLGAGQAHDPEAQKCVAKTPLGSKTLLVTSTGTSGWVKSGPFAQNYADLFGVKPSDEFVRAR